MVKEYLARFFILLVVFAIVVLVASSCSARVNLTAADMKAKEAEKYWRFKTVNKDSRLMHVGGFVSFSATYYYYTRHR